MASRSRRPSRCCATILGASSESWWTSRMRWSPVGEALAGWRWADAAEERALEDAAGGYGFQLVRSLASRSEDSEDHGTMMWCEIDCDGAASGTEMRAGQ